MRAVSDFGHVLGVPLRVDNTSELRALGDRWNVELPSDFLETLTAYGDALYSDYMRLYGPETLGFVGSFSESVTDWRSDEYGAEVDLLPERGGLLLWGDTVEGDMLCLERVRSGWRVVVSSKCTASWYEYDEDFSDWLYGAMTGTIATEWLPEWDPMPHSVRKFGRLPFGVPMGDGPAGAVP